MSAGSSPPHELLVVGAGPCGLAVGAAARAAGIPCVLLDRGPLVSTIERYPLRMTFFSTPERLEIGGVPFAIAGDKPTRAEALAYYRAVAARLELDVRPYRHVVEVGRDESGFRLRTRGPSGAEGTFRARHLVLATGGFDRFVPLEVPGEDLPKVVHWFREPHRYYGQEVLVVGGGNSAVEAALATWRAGGRVTLLHQFEDFDEGVKPWILPDIRGRIREGSVRALWRHRVEAVEPERVRIRDLETSESRSLPNDWVLAMTGYRADPRLLEELGVPRDDAGVPAHDPETLVTPVPGLYVAGSLVAGGDAGRVFIENGRHHGERIVAHLASLAGGNRAKPVKLERVDGVEPHG